MTLLRRLNDLPIFDPSRWPAREFLARLFGCLAVALFLGRRIHQFPAFPGIISDVAWVQEWLSSQPFLLERWYAMFGYTKSQIRLIWGLRFAVWLIESGILIAYIVAFLTRDRAKSVAKGFVETVFPLLMGALPFAIVMTNYTFGRSVPPGVKSHLLALGSIFALLILGGTLNLVGLFTLRRSFTIMSEARTLVARGIYRFVRHPIYASHFLIYLGYTLLHLHPATVAIYLALIAGQTIRARVEERKLAAAFPEYEEYRRGTGMFFPRFSRPSAG